MNDRITNLNDLALFLAELYQDSAVSWLQSVNIFHQFFPLVNGCSKFSLYQWGFDCQGS